MSQSRKAIASKLSLLEWEMNKRDIRTPENADRHPSARVTLPSVVIWATGSLASSLENFLSKMGENYSLIIAGRAHQRFCRARLCSYCKLELCLCTQALGRTQTATKRKA
jgi:hypothetical protein